MFTYTHMHIRFTRACARWVRTNGVELGDHFAHQYITANSLFTRLAQDLP